MDIFKSYAAAQDRAIEREREEKAFSELCACKPNSPESEIAFNKWADIYGMPHRDAYKDYFANRNYGMTDTDRAIEERETTNVPIDLSRELL